MDDRCLPNGILKQGKFLQSRNSKNKLQLKENGNLELTCETTLIWSTNTTNYDVDILYFIKDGSEILLLSKNNNIIWKVFAEKSNKDLRLEDNGTLALYDENKTVTWTNLSNLKCFGK